MIQTVFQIRKKLFFIFLFFSFFNALNLQAEPQVYFNQKTLKVHKMNCPWGIRCTKNCIILPRSKAYHQGGIPCKVCGG